MDNLWRILALGFVGAGIGILSVGFVRVSSGRSWIDTVGIWGSPLEMDFCLISCELVNDLRFCVLAPSEDTFGMEGNWFDCVGW